MEKAFAWCFLFALAVLASESQAQDSSCLTQLVPCFNYLNSTSRPSSSCCDPLKSVIQSNPQCLCNLPSSNAAGGQTSINVTNALLLPSKCGANFNIAACSRSGGSPSGTPSGTTTNTQNTVPSSASKFSIEKVLLIAAIAVIIQVPWA